MEYSEQIDLLNNDLQNLIYRYKSEYELYDETIIGCFEAAKLIVMDFSNIEFECDIDLDDDDDEE